MSVALREHRSLVQGVGHLQPDVDTSGLRRGWSWRPARAGVSSALSGPAADLPGKAESDPPTPNCDDGTWFLSDYMASTRGLTLTISPSWRSSRANAAADHLDPVEPHVGSASLVPAPPAPTLTRRTGRGTSGPSAGPPARGMPVFPVSRKRTWTGRRGRGTTAYDFQPDLNWSNPAVREEIRKVMGFWLQLGASGFRIDAAPFILEQVGAGVDPPPEDFTILDDWRQEVQWRKGDAVLLCEANVEPDQVTRYCTETPDGPNTRAHMLFNFLLNPRLWLALARCGLKPIIEACVRRRSAADRLHVGHLPAQPTSWISAALPRTSRRSVPRCAPNGHAASTTVGSGDVWLRCCVATSDGHGWRTPCSSRCPARRCCATAGRSAWGEPRCAAGMPHTDAVGRQPRRRFSRATKRSSSAVIPRAAASACARWNVLDPGATPSRS